jgi:hypothetical protein
MAESQTNEIIIYQQDNIAKLEVRLENEIENLLPGIIYVLRNINQKINIDNQNRLHPFYMVYISEERALICDHLSPKRLLDEMRFLCQTQKESDRELCAAFNAETKDGRDSGFTGKDTEQKAVQPAGGDE